MIRPFENLPDEALRTYRVHRWAESLRMFSMGVIGLGEAVLRRSLGASELQITLFTVLPASACLLAGFWGVTMEGRSKRPFFLLAAVGTRLLLVFLLLVDDAVWFVAVFAVSALAEPAFLIAQNSMFQGNYPAHVRARMVGRVNTIGRIGLLAGALAGGWLVDRFPERAHLVLAAGSLAGFWGLAIYGSIPIRKAAGPATRSLRRLLPDVVAVLRDHPAFRRYEVNFLVYGVAFLLLLPVTVFILVDTFEVSYTKFNFVKFVLVQFGIMVAYPFAGRLMDQGGPYRTAAWAFGTLALYPLLLAAAIMLRAEALLWAAFLSFGGSLALVDVAWNLSSAHFARDRDSSPFMGVHILLVGVRALFAPFLGLWLYRSLGYYGALGVGSGLFFLAGALMWSSPDRESEERAAADMAAGSAAPPQGLQRRSFSPHSGQKL